MSLLNDFRKVLGTFKAAKTRTPPESQLSEEDEAKAKINRAIEIIKLNKVCENAAFLINEFQTPEFAGIKYSKKVGGEVAAKDLDQKEWFKVAVLVRYEFSGKVIELVTLNMNNWSSEFGGRDETGTFLVRLNGSTVLETACSRRVINEASDRAFFVDLYAHSLATFKAGDWMTDLGYLVKESNDEKARQRLASEKRAKEKLMARADQIDLG